jgi:hypothetical protein
MRDYQPDTVVLDLEEWKPKRRKPADEVDMQVIVDSVWHKRTPDHAMTACGNHRLHSQFHAIRHPQLIGRLCPTCFTPFELGIADAANAAEYEKAT